MSGTPSDQEKGHNAGNHPPGSPQEETHELENTCLTLLGLLQGGPAYLERAKTLFLEAASNLQRSGSEERVVGERQTLSVEAWKMLYIFLMGRGTSYLEERYVTDWNLGRTFCNDDDAIVAARIVGADPDLAPRNEYERGLAELYNCGLIEQRPGFADRFYLVVSTAP